MLEDILILFDFALQTDDAVLHVVDAHPEFFAAVFAGDFGDKVAVLPVVKIQRTDMVIARFFPIILIQRQQGRQPMAQHIIRCSIDVKFELMAKLTGQILCLLFSTSRAGRLRADAAKAAHHLVIR